MHFHAKCVCRCSTFLWTTYDSCGANLCETLLLFLFFLLFLLFLFESCSSLCFFLRFSSWWRIVEVLPLQKAVQETQRLILQVWTPVPTSIPQDDAFPCQMCVGVQPFLEPYVIHVVANLCETLLLFLFFLLFLLFLFESCSSLCFFLRFSSWWRIAEVLPLQKAVQETQRLILQVWTPVPTSIPQDKAIKRNQGCLLVIAFVGVRHHKRFLEPLNTLR